MRVPPLNEVKEVSIPNIASKGSQKDSTPRKRPQKVECFLNKVNALHEKAPKGMGGKKTMHLFKQQFWNC